MMPADQRQPNDFPEFLLDSRVSPAMERHYLAWRSFDQGSGVWASVETVAKKLRVDRTTVQRNLRRLQAVGLIQVKEQFQGHHQRTSFYLFPTPEWWVDPGRGEGRQHAAPIGSECGSDVDQEERTEETVPSLPLQKHRINPHPSYQGNAGLPGSCCLDGASSTPTPTPGT